MDRHSKSIEVLHVVGAMNRAGAETFLMNILRNWNNQDIRLSFLYYTDAECHYDDEILSLGAKIYRLVHRNRILRLYELYKLLRKNKQITVIHSHTLHDSSFVMVVSWLCGLGKRITHSHNTNRQYQCRLIDIIYRKFTSAVIGWLATDLLACGHQAGRYLFGEQNFRVINNAIDLGKFNSVKRHGQNEKLRLLQIGRLEKVKNHTYTLKLMEVLQKLGRDFELSIVGTGTLESELKIQTKSMKLDSCINFLGSKDNIEIIMAEHDILLLPSYHEGFPVVLVEAQAMGMACVVSDLVSDEVDLGLGLIKFLPINIIDVWIETILSISRFPNLDENLIKDTIRTKEFDIQMVVKKLQKIYGE